MVPLPQASDSAGQSLSQPQHTRSGCFGTIGSFDIASMARAYTMPQAHNGSDDLSLTLRRVPTFAQKT